MMRWRTEAEGPGTGMRTPVSRTGFWQTRQVMAVETASRGTCEDTRYQTSKRQGPRISGQ
jgi:hypothetical protein